MLAFAIFAVTFVVVLIAAVIYFYPGSTKTSTIPGMDPTDPREGNFPDIGAAGSMHEFLANLHETYGTIASFWFGTKFTVSIASPELFKEHMGVFDRPPELFALFKPLIGRSSIHYANKADGRRRRIMYDPPFTQANLRNYCGTFNELACELEKKLLGLPKDEHLPLMQYCHALVIKALTRIFFGDYFKDEGNILKFRHSFEICWSEMETSLTQCPAEDGSDRDKKFKEALGFMHDSIRAIMKKRKAKPVVGSTLFIDVLLENELPEEQVLDDCLSYMMGAFHTSGNLMAWTIYFLATHQDCQEKLHQEVTKVKGQVEQSQLDQLKYLHHVINESLRLSILTPYAARFQDSDTELGGHIIPAGTSVYHALGVVLEDPEIWPEPQKFDPERFSEDNITQRQETGFQPFGFAGKRSCPGQHFAYAQMTIFLAVLCRTLKFNLVEGQVVVPRYGLVTSPEEEIWVTVEKRK
ncbi:cytochrome P450 20A1-like [Asterias amurensis]|uniref:cytochrome P450 20A1-like n=1 Tax=Asterias amurensis TaxID=7602 RepID=UPI003AB8420A